jgi:hypothetical protein
MRLPTLEQRRDDPATAWTTLTVPRWYSQAPRVVEVVSQTAVWYHTGLPPVSIRWVLIRDPQGKFAIQALLCTDLEATPLQILSCSSCAGRWKSPSMLPTVETDVRLHSGR